MKVLKKALLILLILVLIPPVAFVLWLIILTPMEYKPADIEKVATEGSASDAGKDRDSFQFYVIDGFLVSKNVEVESCKTKDCNFVNSDHNPVVLDFKLN